MSDRPHSEISAEERIELYCADFGKTLDPANQLADILICVGEQLSFILGQDKADELMNSLCKDIQFTQTQEDDEDLLPWRNLFRQYSRIIATDHPGGEIFFHLLAYAQYGIVIEGSKNAAELKNTVDHMIDQLEKFQASYTQSLWEDESQDQISTLVNWAKGRQALDNNDPIGAAGLALLGGVTERTIRNLMSKKQNGLRSIDGKVRFEDAEQWLSTKRHFWNSVWMSQDFSDQSVETPQSDEKYIFVPVTRDGSVFHPGLVDTYGYRIDPKGEQIDFETYDDALDKLQSMPKPYWSRKNTNGNRVVLSGIRWERLSETELKKFEDDPERRLQAAL